ncbi:unnamed protein product [Brachionus calyciflorus]|uniref:coproporphyrinogen oxidase n=1 Tax=Brachionus calyciflorus TaxID=104777 RepID=A0A813XHE1_9BILA|nr:unnamed protein product [Brachionus calyciflorus]
MFRNLKGTLYTFAKRNSEGIFCGVAGTGLLTVYAVNKDNFSPDKKPHHAFSLFSSSSSDIDLSDCLTNTITDENELRANSSQMKNRMEAFITNLQGKIIKKLQSFEPETKFKVDRWLRKEGGGGITCIIEDGQVFERGAVNISVVSGMLPKAAVNEMRARGKTSIPAGKDLPFFACGISSVIHPRNPYVPTVHFNYRYFELEVAPNKFEWWFGGGTDLTPYYLDENDVKHFHSELKKACDKNDKSYYLKFKKWCDEYFVISHRNECRGVGGIFFDDLDKPDQDKVFEFVKSCGNSVLPSYIPLIEKNKDKGYGYKEREWQLLRRGRYVEFNLVYDRGTKFGLLTPGSRIESILVSLPQTAKWTYKHEPEVGSEEHKLFQVLKNPKDWL